MKNQIIKYSFILLIFSGVNAFAQTNGRDFKTVDDYVKGLGPLDSMSMGTINNVVSNKFEDKIDRVRAIYDWIALHISYDIKAARNNTTMKNSPTEVLLYRKAVGIGFAGLFQDMCSSADIRCLTVDGFVKNNTEQIDEKGSEINHSWAVVQLGQSPDTWFYVDPAWGSGYADAEMKIFTKAYTDAYFFTDKPIFNLQHYPDNEAWKLGSAPKNKKDFYTLPVIKVGAIEFGMKRFIPIEGNLKVKLNKAFSFNFTLNGKDDIIKVSLGIGERKKYKLIDMIYTYNSGTLSFSYKFAEDGVYPVTVVVNGKDLIAYTVEVN